MIAGFIIQGSGTQKVVINVAGPSLVPFGITNALANPTLTLVRSSDQGGARRERQLAGADESRRRGADPGDRLPAEPRERAGDHRDAAAGAYTAIVSGVANTTGVGLVGVFTAP
jgi:hypothetical protein